jgi:hypothetical protein
MLCVANQSVHIASNVRQLSRPTWLSLPGRTQSIGLRGRTNLTACWSGNLFDRISGTTVHNGLEQFSDPGMPRKHRFDGLTAESQQGAISYGDNRRRSRAPTEQRNFSNTGPSAQRSELELLTIAHRGNAYRAFLDDIKRLSLVSFAHDDLSIRETRRSALFEQLLPSFGIERFEQMRRRDGRQ